MSAFVFQSHSYISCLSRGGLLHHCVEFTVLTPKLLPYILFQVFHWPFKFGPTSEVILVHFFVCLYDVVHNFVVCLRDYSGSICGPQQGKM